MEFTEKLKSHGFSLAKVEDTDFESYCTVKKVCYEKYVVRYYGGWDDAFQHNMNKTAFENTKGHTAFYKILMQDEVVGFFSFNVKADVIEDLTIQMLPQARNKGIGTFYLHYLTALAKQEHKPVVLKVFQSNPAKALYERHGFRVYEDIRTHFMMKYDPDNGTEGMVYEESTI